MADYYETLGIDPTSPFHEVQSAYFKKAKEAFELNDKEHGLYDFYLVHQALAFVAGKSTGLYYSLEKSDYTELKISEIGDWENKFEEREDDIYEHAKVCYALGWLPFTKSDFYTDTEVLEPAPQVNFVPPLIINLLVPIALTIVLGWVGLALALIAIYATLPRWKKTFRYMFFMPMSLSKQGLAYLLNQNFFWSLFFSISNLLLFLFSTGRTFIPFELLCQVFLSAVIVGFLIPVKVIGVLKPFSRSVMGLGLAPFIVNLFFAINLSLSSPLTTETHRMIFHMTDTDEGMAESPLVDFEYGDYNDFLHIRHFPYRDLLEEKQVMHMNIHQGLFGIRVLKSWTLE